MEMGRRGTSQFRIPTQNYRDDMSQIYKSPTPGNLPPQVPLQFTGNNATVSVPVANNENVITANTTALITGSGSTLTLNFGISNLLLGQNGSTITSGVSNVAYGQFAGSAITSGSNNALVGLGAGSSLTTGNTNACFGYQAGQNITTGTDNTFLGTEAGQTITTGSNNVAIGRNALRAATTSTSNNVSIGFDAGNSLTTGTLNTIIGYESLFSCVTGSNNISLGQASSSNYTGAESSNIMIGNAGILSESNVIRIGTQGSGSGQQNKSFIAGVFNTVSGRVVKTTIPGAYPYTTLLTDGAIFVNSSGGAHTINLIATPETGTTFRIKDASGNAGINNITVTPASGNIDGAASFVMTSNYESIDIIYSGTQWNIF